MNDSRVTSAAESQTFIYLYLVPREKSNHYTVLDETGMSGERFSIGPRRSDRGILLLFAGISAE